MSAIPLSPISPSIRRHRTATRTVDRSGIQTFAVAALAFGMIALASFSISSLVGQTMMEQARREGIRAQERAGNARLDVSLLRQKVDRLSSMRAIDRWAASRGMQTPDGFVLSGRESTRVASLH